MFSRYLLDKHIHNQLIKININYYIMKKNNDKLRRVLLHIIKKNI